MRRSTVPASGTIPTPLASDDLRPTMATPLPSPGVPAPVAVAGQDPSTAVARFADWLQRFNAGDQNASVQEGIQLATIRRVAMKSLIQSDPENALASSIPARDRDHLPAGINSLLETEVHAVGNFNVSCVTPLRGQENTGPAFDHSVVIEGHAYKAHVYGHMAQMPSLQNIALAGVALDSDFALGDIPASRLRAFGDPSAGSSDVTGRPVSSWTTVPKKVLIIRIDFPDLQGEPVYVYNTNIIVTTNYVYNLFNQSNGIADFFHNNSYGKTDLVLGQADVTPVYRMPSNAVWYAHGDGSRFFGAEMQAVAYSNAAASYDLSQYEVIGLVNSYMGSLPGSLMTFAGQGSVGGKYIFINGAFDFNVVTHEIGHTYGVFHANRWQPPNGTAIGTEGDMLTNLHNGAMLGISIEYGDGTDVMGSPDNGNGNASPSSHLNHWFKNILNWMPDSAVQNVTTSGVYRVYRADTTNVDLVNHKLALKVCRDIIRDYWVGYRRLLTNGVNFANGATIEFGYNENRNADLIVTKGPTTTWTNAALTVGQSLVDTNGGITFTTIAQGGTAPDEYVDVQVTMQPRVAFATNIVAGPVWQGSARVVVDRLGGVTGTTTVQYFCVDSNAVAGVHYTAINGTLTWGPGDTSSRTLTIPILPFSATNSTRDLIVRLTNVVNGVTINPRDCVVSLRHPGNAGLDYVADQLSPGLYSIAQQPDGKLIIGGSFATFGTAVGTDNTANYIGRLLSNGQRDYTFKCLPGADGYVKVVRRLPDGKILAGGDFSNFHGLARSHIVRLFADGTVDTNFVPPTFNSSIQDISVQPDGKILVCGDFTQVGGFTTAHAARLQPDGALDYALTLPAAWFNEFSCFKIAADNYSRLTNEWRVYLAGYQHFHNFGLSRNEQFGLTRIRNNGTQDPSFNIGLGANSTIRSMAVQPDGKILVGGDFVTFNGATHQHIARVNIDGSVDTNFNAQVDNGSYVFSIVPQPDGKIVIGGWFNTVNGVANTNLARLNSDGSLDLTWDNGVGKFNGTSQGVECMEMLPDGRIMVSMDNPGRIRNNSWTGSFSFAATQPLYTGITNLPGQATFGSIGYPGFPNGTVNIPVQRVAGAGGTAQLDYGTQNGTAIAGTDYTATQGTLTWADGDTAAKTVSVNVNPAASAGRSFKLNLGIARSATLGTNQQAIVTVLTNMSYDLWRMFKFDSTQQTNDSISGVSANPAGDGVQNLLKYALDIDPFTAVTTNLPSATFNGNRLRMDFRRDPIRTDLMYEVLAGNDITTLTAIARSANGAATTNIDAFAVSDTPTNSWRRVVVDDSAAATNTPVRFLQLKLTRP